MRAVTYAHGQLVIHRDLKPSNVLVTADGDVRLLDFGIARLLGGSPSADVTATGGGAMTLPYASPEQVSRLPLGVATDIYSLGVMLYELIAGRRPYRPARESAAALEEAILSQDPVRPSEAAADAATRTRLRGDLDAIILKALNKDPEQRYPSVSAFADDIERYLGGRPVHARPADWSSRARKFVGRNRLAVAASAAMIVALLGGAGVAVWQARVARAEQRRAEAVKDFIASIFNDVDPNLRGRDRPLTALDVLDLARERLDRELGDQPEARIELRRILGDSLLGVTAYDKGAEVLRAATAESERVYGPDAPDTVESRLLLAAALQYDADPRAANEAIDGVVESLRRTNRLDSEAFVRAALLRVGVMLNHGQAASPEAEAAGLEALAAAERVLPAGHRLRADAFDSLATIHRVRGKAALGFEYAEKAYFAALSAYKQDPKHPRVIVTQNVYGRALFEVDRAAEAVKHLKEAAANGADVYRQNGLYVQHLLGTLANIQQAYGEIGEALTNLRKASEADIGAVKLAPSYIAGQHAASARVYLAARRYADADREYRLGLDGLRKTPDASVVRVFEVEHAAALVGLGRDGEARAIVEPLVTGDPPRSQADRHALAVLARIERRAGRLDRALALADRADEIAPARPRIRAVVAEARLLKGLVQLDLGQLDPARATLDAADSMRRSLEGVLTPLGADILVARGRGELAAGRPAEAVSYFEQADGFWRDFDRTHPDAREAATWLARARAAR
jgi:serine/threonine-protein kinase